MPFKYFIPLLSLFLISCNSDSTTAQPIQNTPSTTDQNSSVDTNSSVEDNSSSEVPQDNNISTVTKSTSLLLKTGQTTIYYPKDDGEYQAGRARKYTKSGDTVHEATQNLYWQDSSAVTEKSFTQSEADTYCYYLIEDGYDDWRLPTVHDIMSLIDYSKETPALDSIFKNTGSGFLWTSTPCPICKAKTFAYEEVTGTFMSFDEVSSSFHTRCIRGENSYKEDLTRDDSKEVVMDNNTTLMWQDDIAVSKNNVMGFKKAIDYCEELKLAGYSDWRLPNAIELRTLLNFSGKTGSAHPESFANLAIDYWSSTMVAGSNGTKAWNGKFYEGVSKAAAIELFLTPRCVRETH